MIWLQIIHTHTSNNHNCSHAHTQKHSLLTNIMHYLCMYIHTCVYTYRRMLQTHKQIGDTQLPRVRQSQCEANTQKYTFRLKADSVTRTHVHHTWIILARDRPKCSGWRAYLTHTSTWPYQCPELRIDVQMSVCLFLQGHEEIDNQRRARKTVGPGDCSVA